MSDSARLEASIREYIAPHFREDGFAGSGRTFRRTIGGFIQVVNVQGSRYGGQFAINLGLQPCSIPDVRGERPDPKKITEELCEFRRRLSEDAKDMWWKHESSKESMDAAAKAAAELYLSLGRTMLQQIAMENFPLHHVTPQQFDADEFDFLGFKSTKVRMALALGRMRHANGDAAAAREFATIGIKNLDRASRLRHELESLCS